MGSLQEGDIFFFQAEAGIRAKLVTGVQTCALPIYRDHARTSWGRTRFGRAASEARRRQRVSTVTPTDRTDEPTAIRVAVADRSEERRVGKTKTPKDTTDPQK